jgi:hypothetical protein
MPTRAAFFALLVALAPTPARAQGPTLTLPPDERTEPAPPPGGDGKPAPTPATLNDLLGAGRRLGIGGYGEAHLILDGADKEVRLRRFVLFAGYRFTDWLRFYSELEVEEGTHTELEQMYLELEPRRWLGFRAGLVVVPVGIYNQFHEPPTFPTVERPLIETLIIPSTWRELGVGVYGMPLEGLHYELYAMSGLDADKFTQQSLLINGRGNGQDAHINDAAVAGRVHVNRILGLDVGAAFYYGGAGQDVAALGGVNAGLFEFDARLSRWGFDARAEYARVFIGGAARLTDYLRQTNPTALAIPRAAEGFFAQVGYDVLHPFKRTSHQLLPFVAYEYINQTASLPEVLAAGTSQPNHYLYLGLAYRPHPQVAFKFNYRRRLAGTTPDPATLPMAADGDPGESGAQGGTDRVTFGIGFMF